MMNLIAKFNQKGFDSDEKAAKWVVKYALPFLNANTESELKETFKGLLRGKRALDFPALKEDNNFPTEDPFREIKNPIEKAFVGAVDIDKVWSLRNFVKTALEVALTGEKRSRSVRSSVESRMAKVLNSSSEIVITWQGRGLCFAKDAILPEFHQTLKSIERLLVVATIVAFYSKHKQDNPEDKDEITGYDESCGRFSIGICPNCGIFFGKNRKNQEYCSFRCKDATMKRNKRQSGKVL